jgi:hypothetical protein
MGIISQIPHFYDAPDGKKKRNLWKSKTRPQQ